MLWYPYAVIPLVRLFFHDPYRKSFEAGKGIAWEDTLWASSVFWQLAFACFCIPTDDRTLAAVADWSVAPEYWYRAMITWGSDVEWWVFTYLSMGGKCIKLTAFWMTRGKGVQTSYRGQIWYTLYNICGGIHYGNNIDTWCRRLWASWHKIWCVPHGRGGGHGVGAKGLAGQSCPLRSPNLTLFEEREAADFEGAQFICCYSPDDGTTSQGKDWHVIKRFQSCSSFKMCFLFSGLSETSHMK